MLFLRPEILRIGLKIKFPRRLFMPGAPAAPGGAAPRRCSFAGKRRVHFPEKQPIDMFIGRVIYPSDICTFSPARKYVLRANNNGRLVKHSGESGCKIKYVRNTSGRRTGDTNSA